MDIRRFGSLVLFKAYASLRAEAARNYLGILWWVLDPVLSMAVYYVVFGYLFRRGGEHFVPFLLIGLVAWQWFANTVSHAMGSIIANGRLMSQIYITKIFFPLVVMVVDSVKFSLILLLLLVFLWVYGFPLSFAYAAVPVLLLVQATWILGVAFVLAGLVPFLPDVRYVVEFSLRLAFFVSGVLFPGTLIPDAYRWLFYLNPMACMIEDYRSILMDGAGPDWSRLAAVLAAGILVLAAGVMILIKNDRRYPRVISG